MQKCGWLSSRSILAGCENGEESCNQMLLLKICVVMLLICGMDESCNMKSVSTATEDAERRSRRKIYCLTEMGIISRHIDGGGGRRMLQGSSPPNCKSKCGNCVPCTSVIVPVNPSTATRMDYYPEVWRCRCRNRIYNP